MQSQELKAHLQKLERRLLTIYAVGLVGLIGLSLVSNYLMKDQAARQATSMIKRSVARDPRETVLTLNDAELGYFTAVVYFNQSDQRVFSLPANLDPEDIRRPSFWNSLTQSRIEIPLFFDAQEQNKIGSVLYVFNRFSHVRWAFFIWISFLLATLPLVRYSRIWITENYKKELQLREESTRAELAQRVRHDIRSPLGALKIATRDLTHFTERQMRIVQKATTRINDIVAELELIRPNANLSPTDIHGATENSSLLSITQDIVQEKRVRLRDGELKGGRTPDKIISPEFSSDAFFLFSAINISNMRRALSNIIENAIEACGSHGKIIIRLYQVGHENIIAVEDNGSGIPSDHLPRVTEMGFTHGKAAGTGRGLYYTKRDIEAMGGRFEIQSELGRGTHVKISLPASAPPAWYRAVLEVPKAGEVLILDDQETSRLSLRDRIEELNQDGRAQLKVQNFSCPADLIAWHRDNSKCDKRALYLLDYDLGAGEKTGLEVAEELQLSDNAILVTGHFDSSDLQRRCNLLGLGLIPKSYLSEIKIIPCV